MGSGGCGVHTPCEIREVGGATWGLARGQVGVKQRG